MSKLKENEFFALKLVDGSGYYGDGSYSLIGVKLYKNYKNVIAVKNTISKETEVIIISLSERVVS